MTANFVVSFSKMPSVGMLSLPALLLGLTVGLMVAVFQAVTQIKNNLMLIPKIIAIVAALLVFGGWMLFILLPTPKKYLLNYRRSAAKNGRLARLPDLRGL